MPRHRQMSAPRPNDGCPMLARSVRKSGIPRPRIAWDFLPMGILLSAFALLSGCRIDMHVQPKQNPLSRSDFFPDQRSERPPVEGTVARGQLHEDTYFYTGKAGNNPGDYMPFAVTKEVLDRGRERGRRPDHPDVHPGLRLGLAQGEPEVGLGHGGDSGGRETCLAS